MKIALPKIPKNIYLISAISVVALLGLSSSGYLYLQNMIIKSENERRINNERDTKQQEIESLKSEIETLKNTDQVKRNDDLEKEIGNIVKSYKSTSDAYENIIDLRTQKKDTKDLDTQLAKTLGLLAKRDYSGAIKELDLLTGKIKEENNKITQAFVIPENVPVVNSAPGTGYSKQQVATDKGTFLVNIIAADLSSTRIIVDTASGADCGNDCPVLPLATFVSRNNAYAGIQGSYFCPAEYPTCVGKTNSFDLLLMNKDKHYFNSDNNVYSNNPGVVFGGGYIRFLSQVSGWGRDTGIDGMISNYPLLINGGNIAFSGDGTAKFNSKGPRGFVANKGNSVYIGIISNATVADSAVVLKAMGMENALNLDGGGSSALWSGGYKIGPGRNLANAILFIRK